jgi:hypothetical protein
MFVPLLDGLANAGIDLTAAVITADALHTQRAHAEYLHERGAEFLFTTKENQPTLFAALDALPWSQVPITARDIDTGHGRRTTRTIQVLPAPTDLPFPMSTRSGWSNATSPTPPAHHCPRSPHSASPASPRHTLPPNYSPP